MEKKQLIPAIRPIARKFGFVGKGQAFEKSGAELTRRLGVQRSRWGGALYINIELLLNDNRRAGWQWMTRAGQIEGPHQAMIEQFARDGDGQMDPADLLPGFEWLFAWIEEHLSDEDAIRKAVVDPSAWMKRYCPFAVEMQRWAGGDGAVKQRGVPRPLR